MGQEGTSVSAGEGTELYGRGIGQKWGRPRQAARGLDRKERDLSVGSIG